ncbi:hypothetical protein [Enterobacter soli]|uniref:hypothetical protein n=1 Tax=Enterobacter soli TaxID=885040 RepID=UPI0034CFE829
MRDFTMHESGRGRGFGRHRMGKALAIGAIVFVVLGLLVMSLWNAILPAILGVNAIGFWQALGLLILCRILFGGLGFRPGMFGGHRRMHERWMKMSPEQREAFIQQRRGGFGRHGHCGGRGHREEKRDESTAKAPEAE